MPPGSPQPGSWGGPQQGGPSGPGGPGQFGGPQPGWQNQPESEGNGKRIAIIIGAILAVLVVIGAVLYFTGILGGDGSSSAGADKDTSQQPSAGNDKADDGDSGGGSGDATEPDTEQDDTTDDSTDSGDPPDQSTGGGAADSPEDAYTKYMQALQDGDCDTLREVVLIPEAYQGQEEAMLKGMCSGGSDLPDLDLSNVQFERVTDEPKSVELAVMQNGVTGYHITCELVDGTWKVDPMSISFEQSQ